MIHTAIVLFIGLAIGNYSFQLFTDRDWGGGNREIVFSGSCPDYLCNSVGDGKMSKAAERLIINGEGKIVGVYEPPTPHQGKLATGILLLQQGMEILSSELSEDEWAMFDLLIVRLQRR